MTGPRTTRPPRTVGGRALTQRRLVEGRPPAPETDAALEVWGAYQRAAGFSERTIDARAELVRLAARRQDADALRFTPDQLMLFVGQAPSAGTRRIYFEGLKAWHRWLELTGRITVNPMLQLPTPKIPRREPHPIATEQLAALLNSGIYHRTRTIVLLAAYQGLRIHEIAKLRGEDVDPVAGTLRVTGKGGVTASLPLHESVAALVDDYPRSGWWFPAHHDPTVPMTGHGLAGVVKAAMQRAGVPGSTHSLRHFYGTELVRGGADLRTVQTLLRHASLATTAMYVAVADDSRRQAVANLPPVPPQRLVPRRLRDR